MHTAPGGIEGSSVHQEGISALQGAEAASSFANKSIPLKLWNGLEIEKISIKCRSPHFTFCASLMGTMNTHIKERAKSLLGDDNARGLVC